MCNLSEWNRIYAFNFFLLISGRKSIFIRWERIPSTYLTPPETRACPKPGPGFPSQEVMIFKVSNWSRWEVIARFVDIGVIIDHHCLKCLHKISNASINLYRRGLSWSWSYGSWIYNYMCNQYLSLLTSWVRTTFMARCTRYNMW